MHEVTNIKDIPDKRQHKRIVLRAPGWVMRDGRQLRNS